MTDGVLVFSTHVCVHYWLTFISLNRCWTSLFPRLVGAFWPLELTGFVWMLIIASSTVSRQRGRGLDPQLQPAFLWWVSLRLCESSTLIKSVWLGMLWRHYVLLLMMDLWVPAHRIICGRPVKRSIMTTGNVNEGLSAKTQLDNSKVNRKSHPWRRNRFSISICCCN